MRRFNLSIFLVLSIIPLAACAASMGGGGSSGFSAGGAGGGEGVFDPETKTFTYNLLGVTIAFPNLEEWRIRTKNFRFGVWGVLLEAEKPVDQLAMYLQADQGSGEPSIMSYYLKRRTQIESDNLKDISTENKVINGFSAICWTYSDLLFGDRYIYRRYFLSNKPGTERPVNYDLFFWVPEENYPKVKDEIEAIASTMNFFK